MKITAAVVASAIRSNLGSTPLPAGYEAALASVVKSAALAGSGQTATPAGSHSVGTAPPITLTAGQLQAEIDKFEAQLFALKKPISVADCNAANAAVSAFSAALQA
jgi:hypothetical protein